MARKGDARIPAFFAAWHEKYLERFGVKPVIDGKHARLLQHRLRVMSLEELAALRDIYFAVAEGPGRDDRVPPGVVLGVFFADWVLERLRAIRRERSGEAESDRRRALVMAVRRLAPRLAINGMLVEDVRCDGLNVLGRVGERQMSVIVPLERAVQHVPEGEIGAAIRAMVQAAESGTVLDSAKCA